MARTSRWPASASSRRCATTLERSSACAPLGAARASCPLLASAAASAGGRELAPPAASDAAAPSHSRPPSRRDPTSATLDLRSPRSTDRSRLLFLVKAAPRSARYSRWRGGARRSTGTRSPAQPIPATADGHPSCSARRADARRAAAPRAAAAPARVVTVPDGGARRDLTVASERTRGRRAAPRSLPTQRRSETSRPAIGRSRGCGPCSATAAIVQALLREGICPEGPVLSGSRWSDSSREAPREVRPSSSAVVRRVRIARRTVAGARGPRARRLARARPSPRRGRAARRAVHGDRRLVAGEHRGAARLLLRRAPPAAACRGSTTTGRGAAGSCTGRSS